VQAGEDDRRIGGGPGQPQAEGRKVECDGQLMGQVETRGE
jgi:hypothetical protein